MRRKSTEFRGAAEFVLPEGGIVQAGQGGAQVRFRAVAVAHGGLNAGVIQKGLRNFEACAASLQFRAHAVAEGVGGNLPLNPGKLCVFTDNQFHGAPRKTLLEATDKQGMGG